MDQATVQKKISKNSKKSEYVQHIHCSDLVKKLIQQDIKDKRRSYDEKLFKMKKEAKYCKKNGKVNIYKNIFTAIVTVILHN